MLDEWFLCVIWTSSNFEDKECTVSEERENVITRKLNRVK